MIQSRRQHAELTGKKGRKRVFVRPIINVNKNQLFSDVINLCRSYCVQTTET